MGVQPTLSDAYPSPVYEAIRSGNLEIFNFILQRFELKQIFDLIKTDPDILILAVSTNNLSIVKEILKYSANVNHKMEQGDESTAISYAVNNGNPEMVKLLLDHGADPYIRNKHGKNAYDQIRERLKFASSQKLENYRKIERLLRQVEKNKDILPPGVVRIKEEDLINISPQ